MNIDLTPIIQAILGLVVAIITYRIIPWIKAKTTNEQQAYINALVKAGVFAAEQLYKADNMGERKMRFVKDYLHGKGFEVDTTTIEAAVSEYINMPCLTLTSPNVIRVIPEDTNKED